MYLNKMGRKHVREGLVPPPRASREISNIVAGLPLINRIEFKNSMGFPIELGNNLDYSWVLDVVCDQAITVANTYKVTAEELRNPHRRSIGYLVDFPRTQVVVGGDAFRPGPHSSEMQIESQYYDLVMHTLLKIKDAGFLMVLPFIGFLRESRNEYTRSLEGWKRSDEEGINPGLVYEGSGDPTYYQRMMAKES